MLKGSESALKQRLKVFQEVWEGREIKKQWRNKMGSNECFTAVA